MVFFEVQPGHSFHSVEEVVVEGDKEKGGVGARVSLSGWFHKPIEGEEGYEGSEGFKPKSSLQQLVSGAISPAEASAHACLGPTQYATTLSAATPYPSPLPLPLPTIPSASDLAYLTPLVNPAYLTPKVVSHLRSSFCDSSHLVLADFLHPSLATELEALIRARDADLERGRRGVAVGGQRANQVPPHDAGEDASEGWEVVGPPHLQRYLSLSASVPAGAAGEDRLATLLRQVHALFTSQAFAALLASLTSLLPTAYTTAVRRFRPGLDYTLARGEAAGDSGASAKLDVGLGLTPRCAGEGDRELWAGGDVGGWDVWLANEEGGDEATYGGAGEKTKGEAEQEQEQEQQEKEGTEGEEEEEEEDDGPLLALEPEWNRLHLVLRDPGVLAFVKYVSARAPASRWDVAGEWEVQGVEEEDDDNEAGEQ